MGMKSRANKTPDDEKPRIDMPLVLMVLLGVAVLLFLTSDLWPLHP